MKRDDSMNQDEPGNKQSALGMADIDKFIQTASQGNGNG